MSYGEFIPKDFGINIKLAEIAKDIQEKQNCDIAMEFAKNIGRLLKKNGVIAKITEYTDENARENSIEYRYGVSIDELDFTEHDKVFEDKISELKAKIEIKNNDYKTALGLLCSYQQENESLKKRITELEAKNENLVDMLNEIQLEKAHIDCDLYDAKQRIAELESKETKSFDEVLDDITIDGYKCKIIKTESGLYISRDEIYRIIDKEKEPLKQKRKELEDKHQSDCIEINRLNTTIDVLIHKVEYLRQFVGLE